MHSFLECCSCMFLCSKWFSNTLRRKEACPLRKKKKLFCFLKNNCGCNLLLPAFIFLIKSSWKGQIQFREPISFLFFSRLIKNSNRQPFPRFISPHNSHNSTDPSLKPGCSGIHTGMRLHSGWTEIQNFSLCKIHHAVI